MAGLVTMPRFVPTGLRAQPASDVRMQICGPGRSVQAPAFQAGQAGSTPAVRS